VHGNAKGTESPIGILPADGAIDLAGLDVSAAAMSELLSVDKKAWLEEADDMKTFLDEFGHRLPDALWREHKALQARLES
jgi:phosphoenolpyruvate carboxykinase (GTP)